MTAEAFRKTFLASLVFALCVAFLPTIAFAQIDPTSGMLLDSTQRPSSRDGGLDSGRYTVRPKSTPAKKQQAAPAVQATATATTSASVEVAQPTPAATPILEEVVVIQASPVATPTATPVVVPSEPVENKKARYDRRDSILELSLSPVYIYTDSSSSYWYRSYHTSSPGAHLDANVWLSERFGLHTSFMTSLGASAVQSALMSGLTTWRFYLWRSWKACLARICWMSKKTKSGLSKC